MRSVLIAMFAVFMLSVAACGGQTTTIVQTVEVTRIVTQVVERVVTATPLPVTPTPAPTEAPPTSIPLPISTPSPVGLSRENPVPFGKTAIADDRMEITILKVDQGDKAFSKLRGYNTFNQKPKEGMEYLLVLVRAKFAGEAKETKAVSSDYFRAVGDRGAIYEYSFAVLGKKFTEVFGGGTTEGEVCFQVTQGEKQLVLIYDSGLGTAARYLSLEQ